LCSEKKESVKRRARGAKTKTIQTNYTLQWQHARPVSHRTACGSALPLRSQAGGPSRQALRALPTPPAKNGIFAPFIFKNEQFAKTSSGQTQENAKTGGTLQVTARVYPMADDSEGVVLTLAVPAGAPNPTEVRAAAWEMGATML
jgi:hypothetical protein